MLMSKTDNLTNLYDTSVTIMAQHEEINKLPASLTAHVKSRLLEIGYEDGREFRIPFELMRVYSPSAEVMGHGPGQETLQVGKRHVIIESIEPVGNYAIKPKFSDGHESGLFTWDYLYWLGQNQDALWADYLARLAQAGASRDPDPFTPAGGAISSPGADGEFSATQVSRGGCGTKH
jgi:DUF971 family protein